MEKRLVVWLLVFAIALMVCAKVSLADGEGQTEPGDPVPELPDMEGRTWTGTFLDSLSAIFFFFWVIR
ncbi:MAG: hypothetical protein ACUVUU_08210 [bacterium]